MKPPLHGVGAPGVYHDPPLHHGPHPRSAPPYGVVCAWCDEPWPCAGYERMVEEVNAMSVNVNPRDQHWPYGKTEPKCRYCHTAWPCSAYSARKAERVAALRQPEIERRMYEAFYPASAGEFAAMLERREAKAAEPRPFCDACGGVHADDDECPADMGPVEQCSDCGVIIVGFHGMCRGPYGGFGDQDDEP